MWKEEILCLVQESMGSEVAKEIFEELLDALVESHSVKIKLLKSCTCLSLSKLDHYSDSNESSNETLAINANEELIKFKNSIE